MGGGEGQYFGGRGGGAKQGGGVMGGGEGQYFGGRASGDQQHSGRPPRWCKRLGVRSIGVCPPASLAASC